MKMIARSIAALSLAIGLGAAPPAAWGASPTAVLGSFFERANSVIRSADLTRGLDEPRQAIRLLVSEVFDFRDAASVAVGPLWRSRSAPEQDEFIRLFADLLERGYLAMFSSKASFRRGVTVQYFAESVVGEWASVPTRVLTRTGEQLPVEYLLVRRADRWTVRDVIVDGVSLVGNYRAQFSRILVTSSFTDLLTRMRRGEPVVTAEPAGPIRSNGAVAEAAANDADAARTAAGETTTVARAAYWVQLGAFKTLEAARHLVNALRPQPASISSGPSPDSASASLNRVRVGPFANHAAAIAKLRELDVRGYPGFIALTSD